MSSNRNLAANFDHCVGGKLEIVGQVRGVALHKSEQRLKPAWLSLPVAPRDDGLMTHIIGDIIEVDIAAANVGFFQQYWDIRSFHEAVQCRGAPEIWGNLVERKSVGLLDPRHRLRVDGENE